MSLLRAKRALSTHFTPTLAATTALLLPILILPALGADLPAGFVRLADIDPTIRQDMRYAGSANFLGRPAKGYEAPVCILTKPAADALARVQSGLKPKGLTLMVFDCYRPAQAVADFVGWTKAGGGFDPQWHPKVKRRDLIAQGYIGARSAHSRGSTVDLAIGPLTEQAAPATACGAKDARTLDFGSGFDCFDPVSRTAFRPLGPEAIAHRRDLVDAMNAAGFRNYRQEWWHFTLSGEPYPKRRFNFPVTAAD